MCSISSNSLWYFFLRGSETNKKFYQCPGDIPSSECHKIKTKLSTVLSAVDFQKEENHLSIIVTDLFLQVEELLTKSNRDKLVKPIANALNRGEAVGIFGIKSAYEGEQVNDIAFDPSNQKVYVVGQFEGDISSTFNGPNTSNFSNAPSGQNGFLAQYDTSGVLGWALWIGGNGDDRVLSIDIGESGSIYICGSFNSSAV